MASVKLLKKEINNDIGDVIEEIYLWELSNLRTLPMKRQIYGLPIINYKPTKKTYLIYLTPMGY